ncbi:hypothetical protein ACFQS1_24965 [Paractinoplanes rhizophilus]|uniref:HEAT repeat domain-containing protein n=1 Tax=Paractinoplanes rhizophilus TaxID=1416877 RepID=A0ABW2HYH4_9ACTN
MSKDQDLWAAIVAADQKLARVRAEFYQHAEARHEVLVAALQGSNWDRGAALAFLEVLSDDVPELLEQLVEHAMSPRWALAARRAIAAGRHEEVAPALRQIIDRLLPTADPEEYRRLAELLRHLGDREGLRMLLDGASRRDDPDIREVVDDFSS